MARFQPVAALTQRSPTRARAAASQESCSVIASKYRLRPFEHRRIVDWELTLGLLLLSSSHVEVPSYLVESNDLDRGIKLLQQRSKRARSTTDIEYIVSDPVVVQITGLAHPPRTMLILRRILVGRTTMTRIVAAPTPSDTARRATCRAQPPAVLTRAILSKPYSFNFKE